MEFRVLARWRCATLTARTHGPKQRAQQETVAPPVAPRPEHFRATALEEARLVLFGDETFARGRAGSGERRRLERDGELEADDALHHVRLDEPDDDPPAER